MKEWSIHIHFCDLGLLLSLAEARLLAWPHRNGFLPKDTEPRLVEYHMIEQLDRIRHSNNVVSSQLAMDQRLGKSRTRTDNV